MVTSIFMLNGIPVDAIALFMTAIQTLISMASFMEDYMMVNRYNMVVCGAHGVA